MARSVGISVRMTFLFSPLSAEVSHGVSTCENEEGQQSINCLGNGLLGQRDNMESGSMLCVFLHLEQW